MKKTKRQDFYRVLLIFFSFAFLFFSNPVSAKEVPCEYIPRDSSGKIIYFEGTDANHQPWSREMEEAECLAKCSSESPTGLKFDCAGGWSGGLFEKPTGCDPARTTCGPVINPILTVNCKFTPRRPDGSTLDDAWERLTPSESECRSLCADSTVLCSVTCGTIMDTLCCDETKTTCEATAIAATTSSTTSPYQFDSITPSLEIPLPTLPSFSEFTDLTLQGEAPNRYLWIPWIGQYIAAIYKYAIGIVGVLAGIMIVVGGLLWLTAGGSAERVSTAKSFIESSLVGLVIALTSYMLLYVINPNLVGFESLKVKYVERVTPEAGGGGMEARGEITSGGAGSAQAFRAISCDGLAESGEEFEAFFTSYYVPAPYGNPSGYTGIASNESTGAPLNDSMKDFFCAVAMECSCPNGEKDQSYKCYAKSGVFAKGGARNGWWPCKAFSRDTSYCGTSDTLPDGQLRHRPGETVAADCNCTSHRSGDCKIEITLRNGSKKILQITDTGSGIRGRRFDFFTTIGGEKLSGVFKVKFLPGCTPAGEYGVPRGSACTFAAPPPGPLGPQPASATSTTSEGKIAVIGDSITADGTQYQSYLRSNCVGKTMEIFAQVGQQTSWMLEQFRNNVKGKGFDGLIILGGVNDLSSGRTSSQIQTNLNAIYSEAKTDGIKVTAVTVLPWKDYSRWDTTKQTNTEALNRWILGSSADVKVNAYAEFGDSSDSAKLKSIYDPGDHLHPNAAGSRKLGEIIVNAGACR
ncbi:MAG: GDSL-type esterase/lipase family protein [Patescibacteria group bacterium]